MLRPDGVMNLMVYASYGRSGIYLLQDYRRRLGVGTSAQEMEDLVAVLETLPPRHPLTALLSAARDFRNAGCAGGRAAESPRPLVFVPQLFEFLERSGLTFGRWQLAGRRTCRSAAAIAATRLTRRRLAALSEREQLAAVELWRGTIARHSVLASWPRGERSRREGWLRRRALAALRSDSPPRLNLRQRATPGGSGRRAAEPEHMRRITI